jgi:hypothetical protein
VPRSELRGNGNGFGEIGKKIDLRTKLKNI